MLPSRVSSHPNPASSWLPFRALRPKELRPKELWAILFAFATSYLFMPSAVAETGTLPPSKLHIASDQADTLKAKADPAAINRAVAQGDNMAAAGDWRSAIDRYEWVLSHGVAHAPLLFQLGVSYFRLGELGKSLFYFKLAQKLRPRDHRIAANIAFVASKTGDAITDTRFLKGYTLPVDDQEWQITLTAAFILIVVMLFGMARLGWPKLTPSAVIVLLAAGAVVLWYNRAEADRFGIIVARSAKVSSGPHPFDVTLFKLREGTEVTTGKEHVNSHGRWWHITLTDGKSGWIADKNLLTSKKVI